MPSVPMQSVYDAALALMIAAYGLITTSLAHEFEDFGTDLRVAAGTDSYQCRVRYVNTRRISSGNQLFEIRANIFVYHLITGADGAARLVDERYFMENAAQAMRQAFEPASWINKDHIVEFADDGDVESDEITREDDVLIWTYSVSLMVDSL